MPSKGGRTHHLAAQEALQSAYRPYHGACNRAARVALDAVALDLAA